MKKDGIAEIIAKAAKAKTSDAKAKILAANDCEALRLVFEGIYNPDIIWLLPEGAPPYKPVQKAEDAQGRFYAEIKKLYRFVKGGGDNIKAVKREQLFIQMLEALDPDDAVMMCRVKDKKGFEGLSMKTVMKAFPGIGGNWVE